MFWLDVVYSKFLFITLDEYELHTLDNVPWDKIHKIIKFCFTVLIKGFTGGPDSVPRRYMVFAVLLSFPLKLTVPVPPESVL